MADHGKKVNNGELRTGYVRRAKRAKRSKRGGIGADGKPIAPIIITAVVVILLFVAIYFGTVEGWFGGSSDPASIEATVPPEYTPQPEMSTSQPISALNDKTLTILVIDLDGGYCSLLMSPNGKTLLIDSGDSEHYNTVASTLNSQGVKKLDAVVASSAQDSHIGAMCSVINDYEIGVFYICPGIASSGKYPELMGLLEEKEIRTKELTADSPNGVQWDKSCTIDVLAPLSAAADADGGVCIALRVEHSGCSVLFAGELDFASETAVVESVSAGRLKSTVLCVAANGADGSTGQQFLNAVSPAYAVIPVGSGSSGLPSNAVISRLNAKGIKVFRTDKNGTVAIIIDKDGIKVK